MDPDSHDESMFLRAAGGGGAGRHARRWRGPIDYNRAAGTRTVSPNGREMPGIGPTAMAEAAKVAFDRVNGLNNKDVPLQCVPPVLSRILYFAVPIGEEIRLLPSWP